MMRILAMILMLSLEASAKTGRDVRVQIVSSGSSPQSEQHYQPSTLECDNEGCTGTPGHSYTTRQDEVPAAAIIDGDKVLLGCGERRRKTCYVLGPGTYTGAIKGKRVWITRTTALPHEVVKCRFNIVGVW